MVAPVVKGGGGLPEQDFAFSFKLQICGGYNIFPNGHDRLLNLKSREFYKELFIARFVE
jgi:hypothetical protein